MANDHVIPLIFIAHSLGGILLENELHQSTAHKVRRRCTQYSLFILQAFHELRSQQDPKSYSPFMEHITESCTQAEGY